MSDDPWTQYDNRCQAHNVHTGRHCENKPRPGSQWCGECAANMDRAFPQHPITPVGANLNWADTDDRTS